MGCGYGCIGIVLAKVYSLWLTQADINEAAVRLTRKNCMAMGVESVVVKSDCFENIPGSFDTITINPPIHAGKAVVYRMFEESAEHLHHGGKLYVVTLKKHGALSPAKAGRNIRNCAVVTKRGYFVFCCTRNPGSHTICVKPCLKVFRCPQAYVSQIILKYMQIIYWCLRYCANSRNKWQK